jgi:hypothetical protein
MLTCCLMGIPFLIFGFFLFKPTFSEMQLECKTTAGCTLILLTFLYGSDSCRRKKQYKIRITATAVVLIWPDKYSSMGLRGNEDILLEQRQNHTGKILKCKTNWFNMLTKCKETGL